MIPTLLRRKRNFISKCTALSVQTKMFVDNPLPTPLHNKYLQELTVLCFVGQFPGPSFRKEECFEQIWNKPVKSATF